MGFQGWSSVIRFAEGKIHYHLKCQDITDNGSDNKLWLTQSIQIVVFASDIGHIDNKGWDFEHGGLFLHSQMVNIH